MFLKYTYIDFPQR